MNDLARSRGSVTSAVASSAVATAAVLALLVGLNFGFGESGGAAPARAAEQADLTDPVAAEQFGPVPSAAVPGGLPTVDEPAATRAEPATEPVATEPVAAEPAAAEPAAAPPDVTVVVLNQTTRRGLAAEFRGVLAAAGWQVGPVGNFRGNVPQTTVYFPPGLRAQAKALAAAFGQVDRIRPAFDGIPADKLTVILCKDYPRT